MYSYSDVLLRFFSGLLAAFLGFVALYSLVTDPEGKSVKGLVLFTLMNAAIAFAAHRRIQAAAKQNREYLSRFEGLPIQEAVAKARGDGKALPQGLVAHKVRVPFSPWFAFERHAFQFVLAEDDRGRARAFEI